MTTLCFYGNDCAYGVQEHEVDKILPPALSGMLKENLQIRIVLLTTEGYYVLITIMHDDSNSGRGRLALEGVEEKHPLIPSRFAK